jgi:hypothetical protein
MTAVTTARNLTLEEIRVVADLRIMHAKVDELHQLVDAIRQRHSEAEVHKYADAQRLADDIRKVDEIYLWFVKLKEEGDRRLSSSH